MMARALSANGASKIFIIGRRPEALQKTVDSSPHKNIVPLAGDVTSKKSLESLADEVGRHVDHVDVLIANSGISGPSAGPKPREDQSPPSLEEIREHLWNTPMEDFNQALIVNVTGMFYTAVAFLPLLAATNRLNPAPSTKPRPQIIATSSIGGFNRQPLAGFAYSASKAAVNHLVKSMATVFGRYDIRVNSIAPGLYLSEMSEGLFARMGITEGTKEGSFPRDLIPMTRGGGEEDIAGVVLWLCSRAGSYVSGNVVVTDGGRLGVQPATY